MSRRPVGRILAGLVLGLVLLGLAAWAWIDAAAARRWTSLQKRFAELKAEARGREHRRPARPGLMPGDAWDDYLEALDLLDKDPAIDDALPDPREPDPAKVEALLDRNPRVLELLRRGARRATARHPDLREEDFWSSRLVPLDRFAAVGQVSARRLAREGRVEEAAGVLLDLFQLGNDAFRDVITSSAPTGLFHDTAARELLALKLADPAKIEREIERLEADYPSCEASLRDEALRTALIFDDPDVLPRLTAWQARRHGFSTRLLLAGVFEGVEERLRELAGIDALPFARTEELVEDLLTRAAEMDCLQLKTAELPLVSLHVYAHRRNLARLRMLRAALHWKATGERLDLADPFGTTLRWSKPGGPLRIWSVSNDGTDDGGDEKNDFVLTIP